MRRYLFNQEIKINQTFYYDALIIGSGIAGLYAALNLDKSLSCAILTKESMDISNSWLAQGGIAAAVSKEDQPQFHYEDTLTAGAGLCNKEAVRVLVDEGPKDIENLVALHVPFDLNIDGDLRTGREGGHRRNRIVHAHGDATGRETVKALAAIVVPKENITFLPNTFFIDILIEDDHVIGAIVYQDGYQLILSPNIVISTGGIGQIYTHSTNPHVATGDGTAAAMRAGAKLKNMEFVQFHPTGLYCEKPETRTFLISEALRGEGAQLKNKDGGRFMVGKHPMAELAPRDIVARDIIREMQKTDASHVDLDITHQSEEFLAERFPTIYGECKKRGINIAKDLIPVCPVQHYMMGGIATDLNAMSNIKGLYACGEAACTGVHGANRLASNSMLECLVFGRRAAQHISQLDWQKAPLTYTLPEPKKTRDLPDWDVCDVKYNIRKIMDQGGWVIRHKEDMETGLAQIRDLKGVLEKSTLTTKDWMEAYNMACVAEQILMASLRRKKSVGAHYRED